MNFKKAVSQLNLWNDQLSLTHDDQTQTLSWLVGNRPQSLAVTLGHDSDEVKALYSVIITMRDAIDIEDVTLSHLAALAMSAVHSQSTEGNLHLSAAQWLMSLYKVDSTFLSWFS